ncbi:MULTISPECIES: Flp family type IVb pilin [unclassified Aminobacter]|jgi:pilus assembly protein Flp/PilA|uniref:Flp family type IVb pilin n=1 Tax=unclassified Aminobacter TaxID=2644704 RepID=UPI0004B513EB|nr:MULTISPECIES: Flp family type IVb pilin [unclassified Aminobacter]TWG55142.1 pilus assembly protein Flp/PilA [Aminobacter sp. J44]TWH28899.1 pilus assembly protein Flp/PilA [Aminobacter sp. J15]
MLRKFFSDESGATAIEYSLIATLVSLAIMGGVGLVADNVAAMFQKTSEGYSNATSVR